MTIKCDYCNKDAELVTGEVIYPHMKKLQKLKFWSCDDCKAYVGCHKNGTFDKPLGRLANSELRSAKIKAHYYFDPLWKNNSFSSRKKAYNWLSKKLRINITECHIGMFDLSQCHKTIIACCKRTGEGF